MENKLAMRVSIISIFINVILSAFKLFAGIVAGSGAMLSDAVHSLSDVFSTFIVMIGVTISSKESDENHQYGHERLESVASIILSVLLFITGVGIGIDGVKKIFNGAEITLQIPGQLALVAAILSIAIKEWMYWFTRAAAKKINSGALMADAWHHRSDAFSSVGSFIGIFGARMGLPIFDTLASIVICIFIVKAAYDIFADAIDKLVDKSCDEDTISQIKETVEHQDGVLGIDKLKTRLFGNKIYIDVEILANGNQTLTQAHEIAQIVHDKIEEKFPTVKHCMVHINPKI